ncbi:aldo/keto reductase [Actinacidiphila sp. bgisy167]|uniref:aldo/keto reductase n=1 Tax=Actinacidiphila sp. bgisy167 TaxID=3413797 RepID=UPI003D71E852
MSPAETIVEAQWAAERQGSYRFLTDQSMYSLFRRRPEGAVFPTAQRHGMGVLTFSPLNGGRLSGRADVSRGHRASSRPALYDPATPAGRLKAAALEQLTALADEAGLRLPQLAIAFALAHPTVTSVLIGPRTAEQLDGLLDGAGTTLTDDVLDRIDAIVPPGTDLNPEDNYAATPPPLEDARLRRR